MFFYVTQYDSITTRNVVGYETFILLVNSYGCSAHYFAFGVVQHHNRTKGVHLSHTEIGNAYLIPVSAADNELSHKTVNI